MRILDAILLYFPIQFVKKLHKKCHSERFKSKTCHLIPEFIGSKANLLMYKANLT